jgi:hypothetical protein
MAQDSDQGVSHWLYMMFHYDSSSCTLLCFWYLKHLLWTNDYIYCNHAKAGQRDVFGYHPVNEEKYKLFVNVDH